MLGIKQEGLALELGEDRNQRQIYLLKQKEVIEEDLLAEVAKVLKVPVEAIQDFEEAAAINVIRDNYHDNSISNVNYHCTFNPIDKVVELYEVVVKKKKLNCYRICWIRNNLLKYPDHLQRDLISYPSKNMFDSIVKIAGN